MKHKLRGDKNFAEKLAKTAEKLCEQLVRAIELPFYRRIAARFHFGLQAGHRRALQA